MNQITIFLIKFLSAIIAFSIGLAVFFRATIVDILSFSLFVTIVSYVLVERFILPRIGNNAAIVVDFLLTYMSVWIFGNLLLTSYMQIAWGSIISAIIVAVGEVFVHRFAFGGSQYESRKKPNASYKGKLAYGTEFSEEQTIEAEKEEK